MKTQTALRADYERLMLPVYAPPSPVFVRGSGARLWDAAGREYVDFGGGIAVLSLGHCAPQVAKAVSAQAAKLQHTSNLFVNESAVLLAREFAKLTFARRVFFCNSGAEANEAALKLARKRGVNIAKNKYRVMSFGGAFHGRIGFTMAATPNKKVRAGFGSAAGGFAFAKFNDLPSAAKLADERLSAIIVEPTQGEGGVVPASATFLRGLKKLARKHNALLIFDEIQTGAGRTGALYQYMSLNVEPDILTTAKGIAGGFPFGAMLAGARAEKAMTPGDHGTTFGGNALACAAALAVLKEISNEKFLSGVQKKSRQFCAHLQKLKSRYKCFADIRARGLLIGCDAARGWNAKEMTAAMLKQGAVVITAGTNTVRFAPPLNVSASDIKDGFARIEKALAGLAKKKPSRKN